MSEIQRLTNSSDETELANLMGGRKVFAIPYFQRAYKWKSDKLHQLETDLLKIVDEGETHFLGAIIAYGRGGNPADPNVFEVIDGQQRITTVFLYVCAIVRTLCLSGRYEDAEGLFVEYLAIDRETRLASNSRLHCCKEDRAQLNKVFDDVLSDRTFATRLAPFRYKALPTTADSRGRIWSNYLAARRFLDGQVRLEGVERLEHLFRALLNSMTVVQIVVRDPTDGPKIFDSLNSHQEPITTGDLVRNEIFSKIADVEPARIEEIDQRSWQPFYSKFWLGDRSLFDSYFFPYGLILDPNIRKSEVYGRLRNEWRSIRNPELIIQKLAEYQDAFLDVCRGTNTLELTAEVYRAFHNLYEAGAPTSTYPFLMQVANASSSKLLADSDAIGILETIESFLVRRAICGHEPTGLHAVFKRLWGDCKEALTAENVRNAIRRHRTVAWPSDDDVRAAVQTRAQYPSSIVPYLLLEWNRKLGGDQPLTVAWVEHVLPDKPDRGWFDNFTH